MEKLALQGVLAPTRRAGRPTPGELTDDDINRAERATSQKQDSSGFSGCKQMTTRQTAVVMLERRSAIGDRRGWSAVGQSAEHAHAPGELPHLRVVVGKLRGQTGRSSLNDRCIEPVEQDHLGWVAIELVG